MLEIKDVYKTFNAGTVNEKRAINGLNLNLSPGDFVTVIGGNGAGKSTMLNLIAGVFPPDGGFPISTARCSSPRTVWRRTLTWAITSALSTKT